ncbi:MAG: PadR family transcriptional regulator [Candidatus Bathyarchaeia archaeon]
MTTKIVEELRKRVIKSFLDILILVELKKGCISGYDVLSRIHKKYGVLMSSGTVYSMLYSLERNGLIRGTWNQRKRVYTLTEKGKQDMQIVTKANKEIQSFLINVSSLS